MATTLGFTTGTITQPAPKEFPVGAKLRFIIGYPEEWVKENNPSNGLAICVDTTRIYFGTKCIGGPAVTEYEAAVEEGFEGTFAEWVQKLAEDALQESIDAKQDTLVSGTNIKTLNGETLLGEGDIEIEGTDGYSKTEADAKFAAIEHSHTINDVTELPAALEAKADITALDAKQNALNETQLEAVNSTITADKLHSIEDLTGRFFLSELVLDEYDYIVQGTTEQIISAHSAMSNGKSILIRCSSNNELYIPTSPHMNGSTAAFSFVHMGKSYTVTISPSNEIQTAYVDISSVQGKLNYYSEDTGTEVATISSSSSEIKNADCGVYVDDTSRIQYGTDVKVEALNDGINITTGSTASGTVNITANVANYNGAEIVNDDYLNSALETKAETSTVETLSGQVSDLASQVNKKIESTAYATDTLPETTTQSISLAYTTNTEVTVPSSVTSLTITPNALAVEVVFFIPSTCELTLPSGTPIIGSVDGSKDYCVSILNGKAVVGNFDSVS